MEPRLSAQLFEKEVLSGINVILAAYGFTERVLAISDCSVSLFVLLFESLFRRRIPGVIRKPVSSLDNLVNCKLFLRALSFDALNMPLEHIVPSKVISADRTTILNLAEIFVELHKLIGDQDASSSRPANGNLHGGSLGSTSMRQVDRWRAGGMMDLAEEPLAGPRTPSRSTNREPPAPASASSRDSSRRVAFRSSPPRQRPPSPSAWTPRTHAAADLAAAVDRTRLDRTGSAQSESDILRLSTGSANSASSYGRAGPVAHQMLNIEDDRRVDRRLLERTSLLSPAKPFGAPTAAGSSALNSPGLRRDQQRAADISSRLEDGIPNFPNLTTRPFCSGR
eukprot:TRINITY_DN435_c1_g1_i1.p1 TRINITY_DN435_c1_g1~~TRINITY_DN435_c1_g1_i1.p1  ORF type:complete len:338 (-),score=88.05 TRINITY_DN435_c1_g1_i1:108-1121(-)